MTGTQLTPHARVRAIVLPLILAALVGVADIGLQGQTSELLSQNGPPMGWFPGGGSVIGVVRPTNFMWFLTTPTGACPTGFSLGSNSDGTIHCSAQFGLPGDVALYGYITQGRLLEAAVWRPSDRRLYFQPAGGVCPSNSAYLGRLASGAVYCSSATIIQPGMMPVQLKRARTTSIVGGWDPIRQTWFFPAVGTTCPVGTARDGSQCTLRRGHSAITPRVLDYDADGTDDIGYYDPRSGKHQFVPSTRVCPKGSQRNGTANDTVGCELEPSAGQIALAPGDYDGDRIPDVANYDATRHRFSIVPTVKACPWPFTQTANDTFGRVTCIQTLGVGRDVPVDLGDYDGDGRVDAVVVDETTYIWTIVPSSGNCPAIANPVLLPQGVVGCTRQYGLPGDIRIR